MYIDVKVADNVNIFKSKLRSTQLYFLYFKLIIIIFFFGIFLIFYIHVYVYIDYRLYVYILLLLFLTLDFYYNCSFNARAYLERALVLLGVYVGK